jgi:uncharacterized protein (DUF1499 family)
MKPDALDVYEGRLSPCPKSPNCVSSDASDAVHHIEPYRLRVASEVAWQQLQTVIASLPRIRIINLTDNYLHAEARSLIFRFVDDMEFQLRSQEQLIAVRSASRLGYSDLGVNRKRVEQVREQLCSQGVVE